LTTRAKIAAVTALAAALSLFDVGHASAQTAMREPELVDKDVKGTVGLGLIGLEVGMLMPGITGLTDAWAWAVFPAIGAAGGVVGGIFAFEQRDSAKPKAAVATLGIGIGLAIPMAVASLALANKRKRDDEFQSLAEKRQLAAAKAGSGLLRVSPEGTFVRVPGIAPLLGRAADGRRSRGTLVSLFSGRF